MRKRAKRKTKTQKIQADRRAAKAAKIRADALEAQREELRAVHVRIDAALDRRWKYAAANVLLDEWRAWVFLKVLEVCPIGAPA